MRRRRADDLFDRIATFEALCAAALRAAAAKRRVPGPAAFLANLETEVLGLERELRAGTWRPGGYVSFEVRAPKRRLISAAPFRDRVVHHALHAVGARPGPPTGATGAGRRLRGCVVAAASVGRDDADCDDTGVAPRRCRSSRCP